MPYIKLEERAKWNEFSKDICEIIEKTPVEKKEGQLNYLFTKILKGAYPPSYFNYNRVIGLLECVKQEFYRKDVSKYEEEKIKENGEI